MTDSTKIIADGIAGKIPIAQDAIRQHQIEMAQLILSEAASDAKAASKELASAHKEAESGIGQWGNSNAR